MKTLSKKLLSLLLVAIMLVAAMPFAAFAETLAQEVEGVKVSAVLENGNPVAGYETTTTLAQGFDTTNATHLTNAFLYGNPSITVDTSKYSVVSGSFDAGANKLTVTLKEVVAAHVHDYKWDGNVGDANGHTLECANEGCDQPTKTEAHKFGADGKCTVCGYEVPSTTYTVTVTVDGKAVASNVSLVVKEGSAVNVSDPQSVLNALNLAYTYADYNTKSFDRNGTTITVAMADKKSTTPTAKTVSITLVSGNSTTTQTVEVGKYYSDYAAFNPAAQDGRTPESLKIESNNGNTRFVNVNTKTDSGKILDTDTKVTIQWKAADRQIRFYTDSTLGKIHKTLTVYSGKAIGELPTEVNGKAVEYWTVWGSRIYTTTTYDWTADYVDAVPHFAGETGKVYLEVYVNGNRTSKYAQVDITHKLQDGVIYRDTLLDTIRSATKNNSLKLSSVSYLFNESEWSQYVRNVNNTTTNTKLQIGTDSQNARYVYVMVNGVTTKTTDPSNPKTGDSAKLGVAAAVLAVAVVGFGAVIVINKKKGAI